MSQYVVICEKFGEEYAKNITVNAASPCDAMAEAQIAYGDGWMAVDVLDVSND